MSIKVTNGTHLEMPCRAGRHSIILQSHARNWSVSMWVSIDVTASDDPCYLFVKEDALGRTPLVIKYLRYEKSTQQFVAFVAKSTTNATLTVPCPITDINNKWTHIALYFTTEGTDVIKLFINGTLKTGTMVAGSGSIRVDTYDVYTEDHNHWRFMSASTGVNKIVGSIAEISIWGRVLSNAEITSLAGKTVPTDIPPIMITPSNWDYPMTTFPSEVGLYAYWKLTSRFDLGNYSEYSEMRLSIIGSNATDDSHPLTL